MARYTNQVSLRLSLRLPRSLLMALDELGTANGLSMLLCACCGMATLHRKNVCVQCHTIIVFPAEQRKVRLSKHARRLLGMEKRRSAR